MEKEDGRREQVELGERQEQVAFTSHSLYTTNNSSKEVLQPIQEISLGKEIGKHKRCESNYFSQKNKLGDYKKSGFHYNTLGNRPQIEVVDEKDCIEGDCWEDKENVSGNSQAYQKMTGSSFSDHLVEES